MADNLFDKVDNVSQKVDDINKKTDDNTEAIGDLKTELSDIKELIQKRNANNSSSQGQSSFNSQVAQTNNKLHLQSFLKAAKKYYHYYGGVNHYKNEKNKAYLRFGAVLLVGLLATVFTSIACKIYSTFTFIENIWMIFIIAMIAHVAHAKAHYEDIDYSCHSAEKFVTNADNRLCPVKGKFSYKLFRILTYISAIANIIYMCTQYSGAITIFAIIFELAFAVCTFLTVFIYADFFCDYCSVYFTNTVAGTPVTIVHDLTFNKLYTKEEYEKTPMAKDE